MAVALSVIQPQAVKAVCDCRFGSCTFTVPRVRFYLVVWHQARIAREPFDVVFRDKTSESRTDPSIRGGKGDANHARAIGWSLEHARDVGGLSLNAWNAEKISRFLCPERADENV